MFNATSRSVRFFLSGLMINLYDRYTNAPIMPANNTSLTMTGRDSETSSSISAKMMPSKLNITTAHPVKIATFFHRRRVLDTRSRSVLSLLFSDIFNSSQINILCYELQTQINITCLPEHCQVQQPVFSKTWLLCFYLFATPPWMC